MDEKTLEQRTHWIFYRLACEDPKYPKVNFFCTLVDHTRNLVGRMSRADISKEAVNQAMKAAVRQLVVDCQEETRWQEITGSWYSSDIYDAVKAHIEFATAKDV